MSDDQVVDMLVAVQTGYVTVRELTDLQEQLAAERAARERAEEQVKNGHREWKRVEADYTLAVNAERDARATLALRDQQIAALREAADHFLTTFYGYHLISGPPREREFQAMSKAAEAVGALLAPPAADPPSPHTLCARCHEPIRTLLRGNFCPPCGEIVETERAAEEPAAVGAVEHPCLDCGTLLPRESSAVRCMDCVERAHAAHWEAAQQQPGDATHRTRPIGNSDMLEVTD